MNESKKIQYATLSMMLVSLILGVFVNYPVAPMPVKLIFSLGAWYCFFRFPFSIVTNNDLEKMPTLLVKALFLLSVIAVVRSSLDDTVVVHGNKWITMFFNPECTLMLLAPCFIYLGVHEDSIHHLKKALQIFLVLGTILMVAKRFITPSVLWLSVAFYPYMDRKYKILILVSLLGAFFRAFLDAETSRTTILVIGFAFASWFLAYKQNSDKMTKYFCYLMIILPIVYVIPTLVNQEFSIFSIIMDFVFQHTHNESFSTDTRTFLFGELAKDLTLNDAWILGKGAYSHYYSWYFSVVKEGDSFERLSSEVTLLQLILRSGILYAIAYYSLIAYAIHKAVTCSNNRFVLSVAVMASGWFFVSCMSYLNGCEFKHLGFFLLLGCCMSPYWLGKTDEEIQEILES